ncbi:hypothetical protein Tco_1412355 [Tanacetum coccineum]
MLGQQMELLGDETDIVPLYYHIVDNFQIQFRREEFCLVTGLRFGVEYSDDYDNDEDPIPFRRRMFSSSLDGKAITSKTMEKLIDSELFKNLHDDDAVSLCCIGILQFVLLGLENRHRVPDWILRDANVRRWPNLYAIEVSRDVDKKTYLMFGFTWAFKGRLHAERLTLDEIKARSDWWVSSMHTLTEQEKAMDQMLEKEAGREKTYEKMLKFMQVMSVVPVRQPNTRPIVVDQHYRLSDFSEFQSMQGGPSSFPTQGNNSFFEGDQATPSYGHNMATPNWQTPMPSHPGTSNWQT